MPLTRSPCQGGSPGREGSTLNLDRYHEQHREIHEQMLDLQRRLEPAAMATDPGAARRALVSLGAKLNIHLAFEDAALYPPLLKHPDGQVRDKARQYLTEMGGIKASLKDHLQRWVSTQRVEAAPEAFRTETLGLFGALKRRLEAEDREFYPLVERQA
jgi:iron-sulfur cluster repair protein YtfE (RIC family)